MNRSFASLVVALLVVLVPSPASGQKPRSKPTPAARTQPTRHALSVTVFRTTYQNPFLPQPSGPTEWTGEVRTGQSATSTGGRLGWLLMFQGGRVGLELGVSYVGVQLADFTYSYGPVDYRDASVALLQGDFVLLGAPWRGVPLYLTAVVGTGLQRMSYTLAQSVALADFNGPRTFYRNGTSWGVGVRFSPIRQLSLVGEYRWEEGDTYEAGGGCYYVYYSQRGPGGVAASLSGQNGASDTPGCASHTGYAHLISVGVAVAIP